MKIANRRIRREAKKLGLKSDIVPLASISSKLFWLICDRNTRKRLRVENKLSNF